MEPSRTGQFVAVNRALIDRPSSAEGDSNAQVRLCEGMRSIPAGKFEGSLLARTRFFDGEIVAAIERGVTQIVILGAGYDDRSLRFKTTGVHFFEVDHPSTQADKRRRLEAIGAFAQNPTLVSADFGRDDVGSVLARSGHDPRKASLFVCEGVLVYLRSDVISVLLRSLAVRSPDDSKLAVSLATHADGLDSGLVLRTANARRSTADREPWFTILPIGDHLELLRGAGWSAETATSTGATTLVVAGKDQATEVIVPDPSTGKVGD
jgi:methyltransferase (TIGR00027 family)